MRVLFAPLGTLGDVLPCIALALRYQAAGDIVTLCVTSDFIELCRNHRLAVIELPLSFTDLAAGNGRVMGRPIASLLRFRSNLHKMDQVLSDRIQDFIKDHDLVISGGLQLWAFSPCSAAGIPHRMLFASPAWLPSDRHPPPGYPFPGGAAWSNRLLWIFFIAFFNRTAASLINRQRRRLALSPLKHIYQTLLEQALPVPDDLAGAAGLIPADPTEETRLANFLARGTQPLYCGFGSMPADPRQPVLEMVVKTARSMGQRVIIQLPPAAELHTTVLFNGDPEVLILGPYPHDRLFRFCCLIIHHGGAGTTETANRAGKPQLIIPHLLDQFAHGRRATAFDACSQTLALRRLTPARLTAALSKMLDTIPVEFTLSQGDSDARPL